MLAVHGLTKSFRGVRALIDVDLDLRAGEVHALLGENGAGKSTLIHLLVGAYPQSAGAFTVAGQTYRKMTPVLARELGIAAVFQEFSLAPDLSVAENLFLGREICTGWRLDHQRMRREAAMLLTDLAFDLPLAARVADLSRAQKQMVEIAKVLRCTPRVLILDEPTASLTDSEAAKLFDAIARMQADGVAILYVSHRMAELRRLSDRVTVLRGGRKIATVATAEVNDASLIAMMAGRALGRAMGRAVGRALPATASTPGEIALDVRDLATVDGAVKHASLQARRGEVVGLAGLVGCGRSELCRAIFGLHSLAAGEITVVAKQIAQPRPHQMLADGLCYFPADRAAEGLALTRPVRENVTASALRLPAITHGPWLRLKAERRAVIAPLRALGLQPLAPEARVAAFSGGNQQKTMLARGLLRDFDVYLFDEPTVGIDVAAKADVYALIRRLAQRGACVLVSSSELPELLHLATRIVVMHEGRIVAQLTGDEKTEAGVLAHYFGTTDAGHNHNIKAARA